MAKRILLVDEESSQATPRNPQLDELEEVLDAVLLQVIRANQGRQNLFEWVENRLIKTALDEALQNKSRASRWLGLHRKQLERRAKKYHLSWGSGIGGQ